MSADTHDDIRLAMAEAGGALSDDDLEAAEDRLLQALSEIRRRKAGGRASE